MHQLRRAERGFIKALEWGCPRRSFSFSTDEGAGDETAVSTDSQPGPAGAFTGKIVKVTVEQK